MFTTLSVQLPTDTLLRLVGRLKSRGGSQDMSEAITAAVESWLDGYLAVTCWPLIKNGRQLPSQL
jgi:hypothetical protein